jgi:hypothetical protein
MIWQRGKLFYQHVCQWNSYSEKLFSITAFNAGFKMFKNSFYYFESISQDQGWFFIVEVKSWVHVILVIQINHDSCQKWQISYWPSLKQCFLTQYLLYTCKLQPKFLLLMWCASPRTSTCHKRYGCGSYSIQYPVAQPLSQMIYQFNRAFDYVISQTQLLTKSRLILTLKFYVSSHTTVF